MKLIKYNPRDFHERGSYFDPNDDLPPRCSRCGSYDILFGFKNEYQDLFRLYEQTGLDQHKPIRFWYCKDCRFKSFNPARYLNGDIGFNSEKIAHSSWDHRNLITGSRDWWFISHMNKEPDSLIVRHISESLVRAGFTIWVDDFEIQENKRSDPNSTLIWALEGCIGAILITSDEYFTRDWCMTELNYLLLRKERSFIDLVELRLPWSKLKRKNNLRNITLLSPESESDCIDFLLQYLYMK